MHTNVYIHFLFDLYFSDFACTLLLIAKFNFQIWGINDHFCQNCASIYRLGIKEDN